MKVSILVLTYNQEHSVRKTLDSILSQETEYEFEIIIGDDSSKDGTRKICQEYMERHSKIIRMTPMHDNYGVVRNWYECFRISKGEYVMECAGDDWWHNKHKIQIQVDYMEKNVDLVLSYSNFEEYYPATNTTVSKRAIRCTDNLFDFVLKCNPICAPTVCIRRSAIEQIHFEDYLKQGFMVEDYPTWLGLSLIGDFGVIDESLVTYVIQMGSLHNCYDYDKRISYFDNFRKMRFYFVNKTKNPDTYKLTIDNLYHLQKAEAAVQYGRRKDAFSNFLQIKGKSLKIFLKLFLCSNSLSFRYFNNRYNKNM